MKIFLLSLLLFLLSACWIPFLWWEENEIPEELNSSVETFTGQYMTIETPSDWQNIATSQLGVPKTWNVILAKKSSDRVDRVYRNMIVLEDTLIGSLSSSQYARNDYRIAQKKYAWFKELESIDAQFADGEQSSLYVFEAKYNPDSPRMKFLQSARICENWEEKYVYNITITLPASLQDIEKFKALIQTFACREEV